MKFYTWLMKNRWRADLIGDLARDAHADNKWPRGANTWDAVKILQTSDAAKRAIYFAWMEYELFVSKPSTHTAMGDLGLRPPKEPSGPKDERAAEKGRRGGENSRKNLDPAVRKHLAQKAARARWGSKKGGP